MATREERIKQFAIAAGTDIGQLQDATGDLAALKTTAKSNLVGAVNEAYLLACEPNGAQIDDSASIGARDVTWSAEKTSNEINSAKNNLDIKDASLQAQINSVGGGKKAYITYAAMTADKSNIATNSSVDVVNDSDVNKNGTYAYNGTTFTKSAYDVQAIVLKKVLNAFSTYALMTASSLPNDSYAVVTNDADLTKNAVYIKTAGTWTVSKYDPLLQAKAYIDRSKTIEQKLSKSDFALNDSYIKASDGVVFAGGGYQATDFVRVEPNVEYSYKIISSAASGGAYYDEDKLYISGFGTSQTGTSEQKTTSPSNARYVRLTNLSTFAEPYFKAFGRYNIEKIHNIIKTYPKAETSKLLKQSYSASAYTQSGFVNINSGTFDKSSEHTRTDYLKIQPSTDYKVLSVGNASAACAWYDANKVFISGFRAETLTTVTSPSNAVYVAMSAKNTNVSLSKIESVDDKYNINELLALLNTFTKDLNTDVNAVSAIIDSKIAPINRAINNPMQFETVVNSKAKLNTVNPSGKSDRAYPIGRRVYDHSLRQEVIADGMFWRLPDGTAASLAPRTYVFPDWDETRKALPTYAKAYKKIYDVAATGIAPWVKVNPERLNTSFSLSDKYGDMRLLIEHNEGLPDTFVYLNNSSAANLNRYIILDCYFNSINLSTLNIGFFSASGTLLFERTLRNDATGTRPRDFHIEEHARFEFDTFTLTPAFVGANMADIAHIGFKVGRSAGKNAKVYIGNIETVTFKPMLTLRFDDQRKTAYENGMPVLQEYGFKGIMAVNTGSDDLDNDPDYGYVFAAMTKSELIAMRDAGWDLVSHTHTHPIGAEKSDDYMREEYRKSREYLRKELGVSELASSVLISPQNKRDERLAMIQREFYDVQINHVSTTANSHMLRQPEGTWESGSLWSSMSSIDGDNAISSAALTTSLIAAAQKVIDDQRWGIVMMHEVPVELPSGSGWKLTKQVLQDFCAWLDARRDEIEVVTITDVVNKIRPVS